MFTCGALFAGIGTFVLGLKKAGITTLWANEEDSKACETFEYNNAKCRLIEKDVRQLSVRKDELQSVDVLVAGFPCQSFSQAGERDGFGDHRGELFFEIIRIVKEFKSRKPSILLLENVPFLRHGEGGRWFNDIRDEIQLAGYWFGERNVAVINTATVTEIPHRRERLFMVAFSTSAFNSNRFKFPDSSEDRRPLQEFLDIGRVKDDYYFLDENNKYHRKIMKKAKRGNESALYQVRKTYVREISEGLCPTLTANMGLGGHNVPFLLDGGRIRKLTERECARLQGLDDSEFDFPEDLARSHRYAQIGNAVTVPVVEQLGTEAVAHLRRLRRQK